MHGGRLASAANKNELEDLIAATSIDQFWIGAYRSETPGGNIILTDGRRKVREGIPEQPVSSQTENGKYVQVAQGEFFYLSSPAVVCTV